jgi:hypothetical protein
MNERAVDVDTLARLLREAESAHGEFEAGLGRRDEGWPEWYARYITDRLPAMPSVADEPELMPSTEPYLNE